MKAMILNDQEYYNKKSLILDNQAIVYPDKIFILKDFFKKYIEKYKEYNGGYTFKFVT